MVTPAVEVAVLLFSANFGGFGEGGLSLLSCSWLACRGGEGLISIFACVAAGVLGVSSAPCFVGAGATFLRPWVVFGLFLVMTTSVFVNFTLHLEFHMMGAATGLFTMSGNLWIVFAC